MMTVDDRGNGIARRIERVGSGPYRLGRSSALVPIIDADADGVPDTVDERSEVLKFATPIAESAYGQADLDLGCDRLIFSGAVPIQMELDSRRHPIAGTDRPLVPLLPEGGVVYWGTIQLWVGRDGLSTDVGTTSQVFSCTSGLPVVGVAVWDDPNFDGVTNDLVGQEPNEVADVVSQCDFGTDQIFLGGVAIPELTEIPVADGLAALRFADFGEYPGGKTFRFHFGSADFDSVFVSPKGIASFALPVTDLASRDALGRQHGAIAACWSEEWDTSSLRLFAGYVPMTKSFRNGEPVYAFAIEWRNLRRVGWSSDRAISMRLLLYSDGTYRTDFGSFDELEDMPLVVGYAGPGAHPSDANVVVADHSWGAGPSGSGGERVLAEAFSATNVVDVGHKFIRWNGYPERLDAPTDVPVLVSPALKGRQEDRGEERRLAPVERRAPGCGRD